MSEIYTRDFNSNKNQTYNPPPGYVGNAFSNQRELFASGATAKYVAKNEPPSEPDDEEITNESENTAKAAEASALTHIEHENKTERHDGDSLGHLIESLRGKIGREELIILLVMLLVASDGIGVEVLILALILIAG